MRQNHLFRCILAVVLASLMLTVTACGGSGSAAETTAPPETTAPAETEPPLLDILATYTLIRPDAGSEELIDAVLDFRADIQTASGTEVPIATDWVKRDTNPDDAGEREILFGMTNRTASIAAIETLGTMDYVVRTVGDDIVIAGGCDYALGMAAKKFVELLAAGQGSFDYTYLYDEHKQEGEVMLRIATYNIRHGADVGMNMQTLANDISGLEMDIVGLQEVDQNCKRSNYIDTMLELSEKSGMPHYAFAKGIDLGTGEYGTGILSKYPIVSFERTALESGNEEQRAIGHALLDVNGTFVHFFNTHLSYESKELRTKQFAQIAELLPKDEPWILTGDFNTADFTEFAVLDYGLMLNRDDHRVASFYATGLAIDNIVFSDDWRVLDDGVLEEKHSDHFMIWCSAQLPAEQ